MVGDPPPDSSTDGEEDPLPTALADINPCLVETEELLIEYGQRLCCGGRADPLLTGGFSGVASPTTPSSLAGLSEQQHGSTHATHATHGTPQEDKRRIVEEVIAESANLRQKIWKLQQLQVLKRRNLGNEYLGLQDLSDSSKGKISIRNEQGEQARLDDTDKHKHSTRVLLYPEFPVVTLPGRPVLLTRGGSVQFRFS